MQKAQTTVGTPQPVSESLKIETRQFSDVCEMNELYKGRADIRFIQKAPGMITAISRLTSIGPLQFQQLSWTGQLIAEAATLSNRTTLIIPDPGERPAFISGENLNDSHVMLYGPNTEHFTEMSGRSKGTQLFLPEGMLEEAIGARLQKDPMNLKSKRRLLTPGRQTMRTLRRQIVELTQTVANNLEEGSDSFCFKTIIRKSIDRISQAICRDASLAADSYDQHHSPSQLLSGVREIFEESGQEKIYLYELCQKLGVSARTLQVTFQQAYGISPMRYLKLRRLHAARARLYTTSPEEVSIKKAALENGFFDRSRFAEDYRKLFGILPSETPRT
jgi:AraC-like DNA-binding protein